MRRVQVGAATAAAAVALGVGVAASAAWWGAVAAACVLAAGAVVELFVHRRVRAWGYCEREDDLLVRRGVMFSAVVDARTTYTDDQVSALMEAYIEVMMPDTDGGSGPEHERAVAAVRAARKKLDARPVETATTATDPAS